MKAVDAQTGSHISNRFISIMMMGSVFTLFLANVRFYKCWHVIIFCF